MRREFAAVATLAGFLLFIAVAAPSFYQTANLRDLALANLSTLLIAAGMTLVIAPAQIDVSVGSLFAVCGVSAGLLARAGVPVLLLPLAGVLLGSLLGAVNGGLVSYLRAPAIVVTLATMIAWRESLNWATGGAWVETGCGESQEYRFCGRGSVGSSCSTLRRTNMAALGVQTFRKTRFLSAAIVLTLALGIGANTAIFL